MRKLIHPDGTTEVLGQQGGGGGGDLQAHLDDTEDAHDASAISYTPVLGGLTATDVDGAIDELSNEKIDTAQLSEYSTHDWVFFMGS